MNTKIERLHIRAFRGVPTELTVSFAGTNGKPSSALIVGDNGTGKSTIVDALEFGLQARIGRHKSLTNPGVSSPFSYASTSPPAVEVVLSTSEVVSRSILFTDDVPLIATPRAHADFSFAAFVLRRADILRFLETAEDARQLMFLDYVGSRGEWGGSMEERDQLLRAKKDELKEMVVEEFGRLSSALNWLDAPKTMLDEAGLDALLRKRLYRGLSPEQATSRGLRVTVRPAIRKQIEAVRFAMREYKAASRAARKIGKVGVDFKIAMQTLRNVLSGASENLTNAFSEISHVDFVERLELTSEAGKEFSLRVVVHLKNGGSCAANQIFSEANQDLVALLVFLSVIEEAFKNGQAPCLVLDDVLQSVDASVRVAVTEHMVKRLKNWQLVVTAHDRLWQSQLRSIFQRHGHPLLEYDITRWTFDSGPVLIGKDGGDTTRLTAAMKSADVIGICSAAGLLQEAIADRLSWTLATSVTRRAGDRYTLGDLWPGVNKVLGKTNLKLIAEKADRWAHLRNLAGAHYNEWAQSLSLGEAEQYGAAILELEQAIRCSGCGRFVERVGTASRWECRCGKTAIA